MYVEVRGDSREDLEKALQQFSKQVKKSELMDTLRKKEHFLKRSKRIQVKRQDSIRRKKREESKLNKRKNRYS